MAAVDRILVCKRMSSEKEMRQPCYEKTFHELMVKRLKRLEDARCYYMDAPGLVSSELVIGLVC